MGLKLAIVVRSDLKMTKGKTVLQVVNTSLAVAKKSKQAKPEKLNRWLRNGQKKVVLKVTSLEELDRIERACFANNVIVVREGTTENETLPNSAIMALGIGPDDEKKIDKLTGHLKLL
ncbi:MAG: aminoacyl-tRNA hydrolase [Candidatus Odinarchaeota archaeon]